MVGAIALVGSVAHAWAASIPAQETDGLLLGGVVTLAVLVLLE